MSINLWFEHVIDAYLLACAQGRDWQQAVSEAEKSADDGFRRVLKQKGLKSKGLTYSRHHIGRKVQTGTFPAPFKLPDTLDP